MTAFMRDSFSVHSPGTKDYGEKHDRIFNCSHGNKKSTCMESDCVAVRDAEIDALASASELSTKIPVDKKEE